MRINLTFCVNFCLIPVGFVPVLKVLLVCQCNTVDITDFTFTPEFYDLSVFGSLRSKYICVSILIM